MITFRPLTESGLEKFGTWLRAQTWESITEVVTGNEKASNLQKLLLEGLDLHLPEKLSVFRQMISHGTMSH